MLVAEIAGRIEGVVTGVLTDHPDKLLTLFITGLGVNEGHPRRGIGRALLAAIRAEGRARGCTVSWVATVAGTLAACGLYRSSGGHEMRDVVIFTWAEPVPE